MQSGEIAAQPPVQNDHVCGCGSASTPAAPAPHPLTARPAAPAGPPPQAQEAAAACAAHLQLGPEYMARYMYQQGPAMPYPSPGPAMPYVIMPWPPTWAPAAPPAQAPAEHTPPQAPPSESTTHGKKKCGGHDHEEYDPHEEEMYAYGPGHPKHDAHRYGQWVDVVNGIASGRPDVDKIMGLMEGYDGQFWKGLLMGAAATLLFTNDTVKGALAGAVGSAWGFFQQDKTDAAPVTEVPLPKADAADGKAAK